MFFWASLPQEREAMMHKSRFVSLIVAVVLFSGTAFGQPYWELLSNGGFEDGFNGWQKIGSAAVQPGSYGIAPTEGNYQAVMKTTTSQGAVGDSLLEIFLGLPAGILDIGGVAVNGSAVKQTVLVNAGDTLEFDYDYANNEVYPGNPDYVFFSVVGPSGAEVVKLVDWTSTQNIPGYYLGPAAEYVRHTGYRNYGTDPGYAYTFTQDGTFTVGFGAVDVNGNSGKSGMLVDDVHITTTIPEPSVASLVLLGLVGLARRRHA
jgi:hypothetical protein